MDSQHGDPDYNQNLMTYYDYHLGLLHKIPLQSVQKFLSNDANRETDRHINKKTGKKNFPPKKHYLLVGDNYISMGIVTLSSVLIDYELPVK